MTIKDLLENAGQFSLDDEITIYEFDECGGYKQYALEYYNSFAGAIELSKGEIIEEYQEED